MRSRKLTIALAAALAVLAGGAAFAYSATADLRALNGATGTRALVTTAQIAAGKTLQDAFDEGLVREQIFPKSTLPSDSVAKLSEVPEDQVSLSAIGAGQLVLKGSFGMPGQVLNGLAIDEGQVAITLQLNEPEHVAGFIHAGSRVALYETHRVASASQEKLVTSRLLPSVLVLAVGSSTAATDMSQGATSMVTVSVSKVDAPRIVQAKRTGDLYFALLSANEQVSK